MKKYNVFVLGATGLVGQTIIKVLEERDFPINKLSLFASEKSRDKQIMFNGAVHEVKPIEEADFSKADFSLFATESGISKIYVPKAVSGGGFAIDNSSAYRKDEDVDIIIPEINSSLLSLNKKIYANPNCSTAQLAVVLNPLHKLFNLKKVVISTYQAVSGTGVKGIEQLTLERKGLVPEEPVYPHRIDDNCLPQIGGFDSEGNCEEEQKMIFELRKILDIKNLTVAVTTVRVPVFNCHSESVLAEFDVPAEASKVRDVLKETENVVLLDEPMKSIYPLAYKSTNLDVVFAGRIRNVDGWDNALQLWITADNLRKGAATNAVQIAEGIIKMGII